MGYIYSIVSYIKPLEVHVEGSSGRKDDWAITGVSACIKSLPLRSIVQAQEREEPIS